MKQKYKIAHMKAANAYAECSHGRRAKVGAVIVKENRIISIGYNGMPAGWDNNCEEVIEQHEDGGQILKTRREVLHAETNAIAKVAQSNESSSGAALFCTLAPCFDCSKLIFQSGIREVYFQHSYRSDDGIDFLRKCGVIVEQVEL